MQHVFIELDQTLSKSLVYLDPILIPLDSLTALAYFDNRLSESFARRRAATFSTVHRHRTHDIEIVRNAESTVCEHCLVYRFDRVQS